MSSPTLQIPSSIPPGRQVRNEPHAAVVLACMEGKYSRFISRVMHHLGHGDRYLDVRSAGASFSFYFQELKTRPTCACLLHHAQTLDSIEKGILANLDAATSFSEKPTLYIIDHQDCEIFKSFTASKGKNCLSYPLQTSASQASKDRELRIHAEALIAAKTSLSKRKGMTEVIVGVVDQAGAYGIYDEIKNSWSVRVLAETFDERALFARRGTTSNCTSHVPCPPLPTSTTACAKGFPPTPPMAPACAPRLVPKIFSEMVTI